MSPIAMFNAPTLGNVIPQMMGTKIKAFTMASLGVSLGGLFYCRVGAFRRLCGGVGFSALNPLQALSYFGRGFWGCGFNGGCACRGMDSACGGSRMLRLWPFPPCPSQGVRVWSICHRFACCAHSECASRPSATFAP